jgi:hypothetical protein
MFFLLSVSFAFSFSFFLPWFLSMSGLKQEEHLLGKCRFCRRRLGRSSDLLSFYTHQCCHFFRTPTFHCRLSIRVRLLSALYIILLLFLSSASSSSMSMFMSSPCPCPCLCYPGTCSCPLILMSSFSCSNPCYAPKALRFHISTEFHKPSPTLQTNSKSKNQNLPGPVKETITYSSPIFPVAHIGSMFTSSLSSQNLLPFVIFLLFFSSHLVSYFDRSPIVLYSPYFGGRILPDCRAFGENPKATQ